MKDVPIDLDRHRSEAAQKATDLRRAIAVVEAHVRELRERETDLEVAMARCRPRGTPLPLAGEVDAPRGDAEHRSARGG
jgi:hypothetical protein